jgi:hypothetical protein
MHEIADAALAIHERPDERQASGAAERLEYLVGRCVEPLRSHAASISLIREIFISSFRSVGAAHELPQAAIHVRVADASYAAFVNSPLWHASFNRGTPR